MNHLQLLEDEAISNDPKLMLEGTIEVVRACLAYATLDHQPIEQFLKMQCYNPAEADAKGASYVLTFDLHGAATARIFVDAESKKIDLADIYGHPWDPFRRVGYSRVWITHLYWSQLSKEELTSLETAVVNDLYFDYTDEELNVSFQRWPDDSRLIVCVQDVIPEFEEDC